VGSTDAAGDAGEARVNAILDLRGDARRVRPAIVDRPGLREAAIATWRGRMINEHGSARVFEGLAAQLAGAGLHELVGEVEGFAAEERRHGVLCGSVVEALGGEARAEVVEPEPFPEHRDADSPIEAVLRNVLSICCLSETVAVALIGAERLEMPASELRDLLTRIWADEVGHARFGWRLLTRLAPTLDASTKARLADYLAVAFAALVDHELAHLPLSSCPPPEGAALGLCSGAAARELFFATVITVIVPGIEQHGIAAGRAWAHAARPALP